MTGDAERCGCAYCWNFTVVRSTVLPPLFLTLLDQLGIDPLKEAEVWEVPGSRPGLHFYSGWYHFVGTLELNPDASRLELAPGFSVNMGAAVAPRLAAFNGLQAVELNFYCDDVPWRLDGVGAG